MPPAPSTYDEVPYDGHAFPQTHPDRLASVARLYNFPAADIATARVLELGCANGENLIPMAYGLPHAAFTGIDLSARQIDTARAAAARVHVNNIQFLAADILDIDDRFGSFDYILCHGVYSWVPEVVRAKILDVCRERLAPNGVAFISYNIFPGWHINLLIRDMMLSHAAQFESPRERVAQARLYLDFLASAAGPTGSNYAAIVRDAAREIATESDSYILHEYLEEINRPLHFHQFAAQLAGTGLAYLADADFGMGIPQNLSEEVEATLKAITTNDIAFEQHLDFIRGREFRQSLIVRADAPVPPSRRPMLEAFQHLLLSARLRTNVDRHPLPADDPCLFSAEPVEFIKPKSRADASLRRAVTTSDPLFKLALQTLVEHWPIPLALADLAAEVRRRAAGHVPDALLNELADWRRLAFPMLQCAATQMVELHAAPPRCMGIVSERPEVSAIARDEVNPARGELPEKLAVTNMRHRQVPCEVPVELLRLADGTRTVAELAAALGTLPAFAHDAKLESIVVVALQWLQRNALLVA